MEKKLFKLTLAIIASLSSTILSSQTAGTLTFTFTEVPKSSSSTYNGNAQHVLAAWVQNTTGTGTGTFVKTKLRYAGPGTNDHLPTWAVNSGGTASNCLAASCNVVDATTGATRSSWTTYQVTWDGKKGSAATGTVQPDGVYKVTIQSTWNHGTGGTATASYTFTKGPAIDHQTPAATSTFSNVTLHWAPAVVTGIDEASSENPQITIYPNPSNGIISIDFNNTSSIKVVNMLGVVVYEEKVELAEEGTKTIDMSGFSGGIYFINVSNPKGSANHKLILNK
jgi:hypothetical protein